MTKTKKYNFLSFIHFFGSLPCCFYVIQLDCLPPSQTGGLTYPTRCRFRLMKRLCLSYLVLPTLEFLCNHANRPYKEFITPSQFWGRMIIGYKNYLSKSNGEYRPPTHIMMYHFSQNNCRRRAEGDVWVFGIVTTEYTPYWGYFKVVTRRNAATLHPIIERCICLGTEVHTDNWGTYKNLDRRLNNAATHRIVNHSQYFTDPCTGVHTQEAEWCWATLKLKQSWREQLKERTCSPILMTGRGGNGGVDHANILWGTFCMY